MNSTKSDPTPDRVVGDLGTIEVVVLRCEEHEQSSLSVTAWETASMTDIGSRQERGFQPLRPRSEAGRPPSFRRYTSGTYGASDQATVSITKKAPSTRFPQWSAPSDDGALSGRYFDGACDEPTTRSKRVHFDHGMDGSDCDESSDRRRDRRSSGWNLYRSVHDDTGPRPATEVDGLPRQD